MKKHFLRPLIFYILLITLVIGGITIFTQQRDREEKLTYGQIISLFQKQEVETVLVDGDGNLTIQKKNDGGEIKYDLPDVNLFYHDVGDLINQQVEAGIITKYDVEPATTLPWWVSFLPTLIIVIVLGVLFFYSMRQFNGKNGPMGNFGRAKAKMGGDEKQKVLFPDVAGADEEKEELSEVVDFLRDPQKYVKLGGRIPRGILLVGPPGTGKTLLAKAVAGEAGVPFYSISGSDFVEMYVGVGASRVRDLFETARKSHASIIFIDEIDAVGRHRGAGLGGGHDEREQTLNQLLVEMDGFGTHDGVIVIAATNRPDILDPALLRPGRFDRQVTVGYPDIAGREAILEVHARNKPFEKSVDFHKIAQITVGFTGADLANLLNESALLAARQNKSLIGMEDIEESFKKVILGTQKKSKIRTEEDNKLTAYHEAGHAVAAFYSPKANPVKHITIIPAGQTGGVTLMMPEKDQMVRTRNQMLDDIVVALGGRSAEKLVLDDISTGASGDIQQATSLARNMVTRYGMSEKLGTVLYGSDHSSDEVFLGRDFSSGKNYSEQTAAAIDDEIRSLIEASYQKCLTILSTHMDKLVFVAEYLLKHETMDGDIFRLAMEGNPTMEELEAIEEERRRQSKEENERRRAEREAEERAARQAEEEARAKAQAEKAQSQQNPWGWQDPRD